MAAMGRAQALRVPTVPAPPWGAQARIGVWGLEAWMSHSFHVHSHRLHLSGQRGLGQVAQCLGGSVASSVQRR